MTSNRNEVINVVSYKELDSVIEIGKIFKSRNYGLFRITNYENSYSVDIEFQTGYKCTVKLVAIRNGSVKDKSIPTIHSAGIIGNRYPITIEKKIIYEYSKWRHLLMRCYDKTYKARQPTYKSCEVSENFKYYDYFYEWCQSQVGFKCVDDSGCRFDLDKDLLVKGNKVYSEDTCVFLPKEINNVLTNRVNHRGKCLIGVYKTKSGKYKSQINKYGVRIGLGYFTDELEAFNAYKEAKENYLKELANKWKDKIDIRAYNALMNYEVEITD